MSASANPCGRFAAPPGAAAYRRIGPFDAASLPAGLLREHRLKEGTWGRLEVLAGAIGFAWDDEGAPPGIERLAAGRIVDIPPTVPHHLVDIGSAFQIAVTFLADG